VVCSFHAVVVGSIRCSELGAGGNRAINRSGGARAAEVKRCIAWSSQRPLSSTVDLSLRKLTGDILGVGEARAAARTTAVDRTQMPQRVIRLVEESTKRLRRMRIVTRPLSLLPVPGEARQKVVGNS